MKVGKEIRAKQLTSKIISIAIKSPATGAFSPVKILLVSAVAALIVMMPFQISWSFAHASIGASVWWPSEGAHISGTQPFKAVLDGAAVDQYEMFWQVDGGGWVWMDSNPTNGPHKEAQVNVDSWTWRGNGPYKVNFIARQNGSVVAEKSVNVYTGSQAAPQGSVQTLSAVAQPTITVTANAVDAHAAPAVSPTPAFTPSIAAASAVQQTTAAPNTSAANSSNPLGGLNFYVNKYSTAATQAAGWRTSRPGDAQKMDILASVPTASWIGSWSGDAQSAVRKAVLAADAQGQAAILVAYNIPQRDCGGYSSGGTTDYTNWIGAFARGIGNSNAVVILEPDSLSLMDCLSTNDKSQREALISSAVSILKANSNTRVYLDAGHSNWVAPDVMADRLQKANVAKADGFATNVSNFMTTSEETNYGTQVSSKLGGKHFVIDTSRNGNGSSGEWCNPWGRAIGTKSTTNTGNSIVDAYLWLKTPGESDGNCNGGPSAGVWWADYALGLVR